MSVIRPVLLDPVAFDCTLYGSGTPLSPDVGPGNEIHGVSVDAAHEHPFGVLRIGVRLKLPPAAGTV